MVEILQMTMMKITVVVVVVVVVVAAAEVLMTPLQCMPVCCMFNLGRVCYYAHRVCHKTDIISLLKY